MRENSSNTILNQYLREKRMYCYYEVKVVRGKLFNFKAIEENQDEGLPALEKEGLVWKLSDEDSRRKPCDGFCAPPLPAYLVLKWDSYYYFIPYAVIIDLRYLGLKSMEEAEAHHLSTHILNTGH
jgi:hypothetical protein